MGHEGTDRARAGATRLLPILLLLMIFGGCGKADTRFQADNAVRGPTLVIGLIPEQNIFKQIERYEPLADHLSRRIGTRITLKILPRYGNIVDNFRSAGLDGAFFGSFTYALAREKLGVRVLARPVSPDNTSTYRGLIFVRGDSGIRTIGDMRGKRFAFVDKATTAGYLLPLEYFHNNGVRDYRKHFRETYFTGTHEDAVFDVLEGKSDIGAAKSTVFERLARSDGRIARELLVLERSLEVPENGLALKKDFDASLGSRLEEVLLTLHDDPEGRKVLEKFGAVRFIRTTDADYEPVFRYAREIRLDLAKYDYRND